MEHLEGTEWPKISIVTPSFNQAVFLERTILSVIEQDYPNLEYIIIDGGSTDGSLDIIKKYERRISRWVSEPDRGQSDAVNKGFAAATGEILGWQNSDDTYAPGAFRRVAEAFRANPGADVVYGNMRVIDSEDRILAEQRFTRFSRLSLVVEGITFHNTSAFWKRAAWQEAGGLDLEFRFAMDYDFFVRLTRHARCEYVPAHFGNFRRHTTAKTSTIGNTVGAAEIDAIRLREFPWAASGRGASRLAWAAMRRVAMAQRLLGYLLQGDLAYVMGGAARRLGFSQRP